MNIKYWFQSNLSNILNDKTSIFGILLLIVFFIFNLTLDCFSIDGTAMFRVYLINSLLAATFFTLPYFFLPPGWRRSLWIPLVAEALLLLTNRIYFGIFRDFYFISAVDPHALFSDLVVRNAIRALSPVDSLFILLPLMLVYPYRKWRHQILTHQYSVRKRIATAVMMALIPVIMFGLHVRRGKKNELTPLPEMTLTTYANAELFRLLSPNQKMKVWNAGSSLYLTLHYFYELLPHHVTLSPEESVMADKMMSAPLPSLPEQFLPLESNQNKNLILIIVESLNSYAIHSPEGMAASPVIHRLLQDSLVVYADSILTRVGRNMSFDGQLMVNTGLFPLIKYPAAPSFIKGKIPSLARSLTNHYSVEAICEDKGFYNHQATSQTFGFRKIYDRLAEGKNSDIDFDSDTKLFKNLESIISSIPRPFFIQTTTLSMHSPYDGSEVVERLDRSLPVFRGLDKLTLGYLDKLKCFDTALGGFIDYLKRTGLYDESVIIIVADHCAIRSYLTDEAYSPYIPFIAINTGVGYHSRGQRAQVDIFPTILDIMGAEGYRLPQTGKPYHGLGTSLFLPAKTTPDSIIDLSEKLFYTDYFRAALPQGEFEICGSANH